MYYVYVLKSKKDDKLYVGCTANIENRIKSHNQGRVKSTKSRKPFDLVYKENYESKYEAFNIEKYYKTAQGKRELKKKLAPSSNG